MDSEQDFDQRYDFETFTSDSHLIHEYTGYDFDRIDDLDIVDYLTLRRDAFIWSLSQTPEGVKYLHTAWLNTQTKPDMGGLRALKKGLEK